MATTSEQLASMPDPTNSKQLGSLPRAHRPSSRSGNRWLVVVVALLLLGGLGAGGLWAGITLFGGDTSDKILTHRVEKGDLVITVTEDGNVESASNKDLKCELDNGSTILSIVEDGTQVKEGDVIVELDKAPIEDALVSQRITVEKARATKIQAEADLGVAEISIKEYLDGTYLQSLQDVEKQITIAEEDKRSAENTLEYTQRMMRKGYATPLQLEAQQFAVQRASLDLDTAKTAKKVLEEFTKEKTLKDLEAKRDAAAAKLRSEEAGLSTEESKLKQLEQQLEKCVIRAPQSGMVVYANERSRFGQQQGQIEEGAAVRPRQTIVQLPDLSQMQVKVTVHETKVETLRRGMPGVIRIQDRELKGTITRIATQPEPGGWMQANVKEYATIVKIEGQPDGLKPGMTAAVEILVDHLKDVLTVPVQAVVGQGGKFYCWIKTAAKPERREVVIGKSNDKFIEIKDGLLEGDEVLLNPRAVVAEAREEAPETAKAVDVEGTFGESATKQLEQSAANAPQGPAARPEGPAGQNGPGSPEQAEGAARRRRGEGGDRGGAGGFDPAQFFQRMDTNGDGKLTGDEIPERMAAADTNGDGVITLEEFQERSRQFRGGGGGGRGNFDPAQMFQRMDVNGDGKLSGDEIPERMRDGMSEMDTDKDGSISLEEFQARMRQFRGGGGGRGRQGGGGGGFGGGGFRGTQQ